MPDPSPSSLVPTPSRRVVVAGATALAASLLVGVADPTVAAETKTITLVALGDSLTAGYMLPRADGFAARLEKALRAEGRAVIVVDAGVSGDTTDMGLARLDWSVPPEARAVIVELGANDALRGLPPEIARRNLDEIVGRLTAGGRKVLVAGMMAPRNLGPAYAAAYDPIFADVAKKHGVLLHPFFLEGVAMDPGLTLPDGLHPNARGVDRIVAGILPKVRELLDAVRE